MSDFRAKCTKFATDPAGGAYSAPPDLLAAFKGRLLEKGREEKGRAVMEGEWRGGKGMGGSRGSSDPPDVWVLK